MNKFLKLTSFIFSLIITSIGMVSINVGAKDTYILGSSRYEEVGFLSEICSSRADKIIRTANCDPLDAHYLALYEGESYSFCSTVSLEFNLYTSLTEKEVGLLKDYLSLNCPEISVEKETVYESQEGTSVSITTEYTTELSHVEKLELADEIYNATGLYFEILINGDMITNVSLLGDLTTDNALTPTDAANLLSYYADMQSGIALASAESDVDYSIIGDFNNDGKITPSDAAGILEYYADKQTEQ